MLTYPQALQTKVRTRRAPNLNLLLTVQTIASICPPLPARKRTSKPTS
jgi:hypothetical protein